MSKQERQERPEKDPDLRSTEVTEGYEKAPHRAMFRAMGYDDEDLSSPMIGIANPAADITPCNVHLDDVADAAYDGIDDTEGMPIEFGTITISDAISMGTEGMKASLISREIIADSVELVTFGERMDGIVTIGGCDKNMPGMMMAAIRTDLPSVFLYGGSIMPGEHDGREVTIQNVFEGVGAVADGEMSEGEEVLRPLREIGAPIADAVGPHPYAGWQQAFDGLAPAGARNYWKSHNFLEMTDGMIETFVEFGETIPTELTEIACAQLGGAINQKPVDSTAYPHRDAEFTMVLHTQWEDPERDGECIAWAREMHEAMTPHATGGVYANFVPEKDGDQQAAYRENYGRMVEVKTKWDPENVFQLNHNVKPTA